MAAPDARRALLVRGRLVWNPTNLSSTFPYGGTALGQVRGAALRVRAQSYTIRAEEFAGHPVESVYGAREIVFVAMLAAWDKDAISTIAQDSAAGGTTGRRVLKTRPGADDVRPGLFATNGALYFAPDSDANPGVLIRAAIPDFEADGTWNLNLSEELTIPVAFLAVPDDDNEVLEVGLREDLTL